ncbi:hypothetical protein [Spiroplasma endosymbiont of Zeiraphera isertana]
MPKEIRRKRKVIVGMVGGTVLAFNFQKNSWWNKKNHQPGLKFDFI